MDMEGSLAMTGGCHFIRRESCDLFMEICGLRLARTGPNARCLRLGGPTCQRRAKRQAAVDPFLASANRGSYHNQPAPLSLFRERTMLARKYLFPHVIELNYQAGRRLGVNVYLIDGGSE